MFWIHDQQNNSPSKRGRERVKVMRREFEEEIHTHTHTTGCDRVRRLSVPIFVSMFTLPGQTTVVS